MKAGVYKIRNILNNNVYIGSSARGLDKRWASHKSYLNSNKHHSICLQRAWSKYGAGAFVFEVLLYCDPKDCLMYEQIALDHYKPQYNIQPLARSSFGVKRTQETKDKMAKAKRGVPRSKEAKQILSLVQRGEKNSFSKLTELQVEEIRSLDMPQVEIATRFGVSPQTINHIKRGRTWKQDR